MDIQNHPLYGKRKKRKPACANPLFLQWLTEWREEAAEKGWKTQYVYGKAIKSLKNYPLPLATGKDCKILENFGDKICKLIDEKLAEHIELHGCVVPPDPVEVPRKIPPKQKKTNQPLDVCRPRLPTGTVNLTDDDDTDLTVTPPPKRPARPRSKSGEQEYIPAYRSGAYAIMLALYRDTQDNNQKNCTPGKHSLRLSTQKKIQSKKKKALTTIRDASLKRQLRLEFKTNGELSLEKRDMTGTKGSMKTTPSPCKSVREKRDKSGTKDDLKTTQSPRESVKKQRDMTRIRDDVKTTQSPRESVKKQRDMTRIRDDVKTTQSPRESVKEQRDMTRIRDDVKTTQSPRESVKTPVIPTTDVYFDLETTGLGRTSSITQMAAVRGKDRFSCFVMPKKRMTREASEVTGIRVFKKKMYRYGKFVKTVSLCEAFKQLFEFLSKTQNNILVGHNIQSYDCPLLIHALMTCDTDMMEQFKSQVQGFLDTKKLFRIIHPSQKSYTQESLVQSLLGEKYKAHDALQDVVALQRLVRSVDICEEDRQKASFSVNDVMDSYNYSLQVKQNLPSLQTMVSRKVISTNVAKNIAGSGWSYSHLQTEHDDNGRKGIESVFTARNDRNRVCVTRSRKIIDSVSDFLSEHQT